MNIHSQPYIYAIRNYIIVGRMLIPIYVNRCVTGGGKGDSFWQNRRHRITTCPPTTPVIRVSVNHLDLVEILD